MIGVVGMTTLMRVMQTRRSPPVVTGAANALLTAHVSLVQAAARLRARLPAYLAQRRAVLDAHCPLLAPLRAIVTRYEEPTTTEELWATGLGIAP